MRFVAILLLTLCLAPLAGWARDADRPKDAPGIAQGLLIYQALPQAIRDGLGQFGIGYLDYAEDLITGYGDVDRIDAEALRAYVGFRRAGLRSGVADSLISADLDGDGAVTAREKGRVMGLLSSGLRARLARTHKAADTDLDGVVSTTEMASYPQTYAMQRFGEGEEQRVMGLLAFDLDGDGWVGVDELRQGQRALEDSGAGGEAGAKLLIGG